MKQYFLKRSLIAGLALLTIPAFAQNYKEKEKTKNKEKETEHIVITRSSDNEGKTVIEIDGDKIKVNGKAVENGKAEGITVQRHKYSGNASRALVNRTHDWDFDFDYDHNLSLFSEDANRAMLGVVTDEDDKGAKITSITDESAAEKAGLKVGDVITHIGDEDIDGAGDVANAIRDHKPGDKVVVTYLRGGKEQKVTAELGKWKGVKINAMSPSRVIAPEVWSPAQGFRTIYGAGGQPKLGLQIQDTDDGNGVKVLEVAEESNAAKAGLKEDDIITHIDDKAVNSTDEITRMIHESREKVSVSMQVQRNGKSQKLEVRMPRKIKTTDL